MIADRRPVAARGWSASRSAASLLARYRIPPNAISLFGMLCGIAAGVAFAATSFTQIAWFAATVLVLLRLIANMLDGMVALEAARASPAGEIYNEVPDRVSDAATLIGLGYAAGGYIELGYLAACVALLVAYVRAAGKAAGANQEFCGPMAKQHRMLVVIAVAVFSGISAPSRAPAAGLAAIIAGSVWTIVRRLRRIASVLEGGVR